MKAESYTNEDDAADNHCGVHPTAPSGPATNVAEMRKTALRAAREEGFAAGVAAERARIAAVLRALDCKTLDDRVTYRGRMSYVMADLVGLLAGDIEAGRL